MSGTLFLPEKAVKKDETISEQEHMSFSLEAHFRLVEPRLRRFVLSRGIGPDAVDEVIEDAWQPTSIWCILCGRQRMVGKFRTLPDGNLDMCLRCSGCCQQDGQRWLVAPYGVVQWVRNLRTTGTATLTRGRVLRVSL